MSSAPTKSHRALPPVSFPQRWAGPILGLATIRPGSATFKSTARPPGPVTPRPGSGLAPACGRDVVALGDERHVIETIGRRAPLDLKLSRGPGHAGVALEEV